MTARHIISQAEVDELTDRLIKSLQTAFPDHELKCDKFTCVVGIAEDGLHISERVAKALNLPHYSVCISRQNGNIKVYNINFPHKAYTDGVLVIDEIADTGETLRLFKSHFNADAITAALYVRYNADFYPNFYAHIAQTDGWLVFPWE